VVIFLKVAIDEFVTDKTRMDEIPLEVFEDITKFLEFSDCFVFSQINKILLQNVGYVIRRRFFDEFTSTLSQPMQNAIKMIPEMILESVHENPIRVTKMLKICQYHCFFSCISSRYKIAGILWMFLRPRDFDKKWERIKNDVQDFYFGDKDFSIVVSLLLKSDPKRWIKVVKQWMEKYPSFFFEDHKARRRKVLQKNIRACLKADSLEILEERLTKFFRIETIKADLFHLCIKQDVFALHRKIHCLGNEYPNFTFYEYGVLSNHNETLLNYPHLVRRFRYNSKFNQLIKMTPDQIQLILDSVHIYEFNDLSKSLRHCTGNMNSMINWLRAGKKPTDTQIMIKMQQFLVPPGVRSKFQQLTINEYFFKRYQRVGEGFHPME
jgi:hypothetical protein